MTDFAFAIAWTLLVLAVIQAAMVLGYARLLGRRRTTPAAGPLPEATIVLCLRGGDPFLSDCVRSMLTQDYPRYRAKVIVDSRDDPAWQTVHQVVEELGATHVEIEPMAQPRETCSLKCSSLLQAAAGLDESCQVMALMDADTIAHPTWLKELVGPFSDPRVAVATGNRWYMPQRASWGTMVRYIWNAAAIVQMYWFQIAWGGTLAIRVSVLRETDLLQRWGNAFCEDTMLRRELGKRGLRLAFVPSLLMVNREDCRLAGYFRWVTRQLLTARLYHPGWIGTLAHGISTSVVPAAALAVAVVAAWMGNREAAQVAGGALILYELAMAAVLMPLERAARSVVASRGEPTRWMTPRAAVLYLLCLPLTQLVYPAALAAAALLRQVEWRGVTYRIRGPFQIHLQEYRPFESSEDRDESL